MIYQKEKTAARIKKHRKAIRMSQEQFAKELGYTKPTIVKWEQKDGENRIPDMEILEKISGMFNCEVGYLLGEYDLPTRAETNIHDETGLNEEAIKKLKATKGEADKVDTKEYIEAGFTPTETTFIEEDNPRYNSTKMIPDLLSHFVTEKSETIPGKTILEVITERIARRNADTVQLYCEPEREYIVKAYLLAESEVKHNEHNYIDHLKAKYEEHIKRLMLENLEEIASRKEVDYNALSVKLGKDAPGRDELIELVYIPAQYENFFLAHSVLNEDNSQMFDYINQVDFMHLLHSYTRTTDKIRKEMLKGYVKNRSKK